MHLLKRPNEGDQNDASGLSQTFIEQVSANKDFRDISTSLAQIHYLHVDPQLIREPERVVKSKNYPFGVILLSKSPELPNAPWTHDRSASLALYRWLFPSCNSLSWTAMSGKFPTYEACTNIRGPIGPGKHRDIVRWHLATSGTVVGLSGWISAASSGVTRAMPPFGCGQRYSSHDDHGWSSE